MAVLGAAASRQAAAEAADRQVRARTGEAAPRWAAEEAAGPRNRAADPNVEADPDVEASRDVEADRDVKAGQAAEEADSRLAPESPAVAQGAGKALPTSVASQSVASPECVVALQRLVAEHPRRRGDHDQDPGEARRGGRNARRW